MLTFNFYFFSKKLTVKNGYKFKLKQISNKMIAKLKVNCQKIDLRFLKIEFKILIMLYLEILLIFTDFSGTRVGGARPLRPSPSYATDTWEYL